MTRTNLAVDRIAAIITGLLALALGILAIIWWTNRWDALSGKIDTSAVTTVLDQPWWPWVLALLGLALLMLGLRWLIAHLVPQTVGRLTVPGSSKGGRLSADGRSVAKAAGEALGNVRGVRSSRAAITQDRGQIVARLTATIEPDADLRLVADEADRVSSELRQVLSRGDIACRVQLKVSSRSSGLPRVS